LRNAFRPIALRHALCARKVKPEMASIKFRFEDFEIWRIAIEVAESLFDVADELEAKKLYRFAEQVRGAALSAPNNIACPVK
jgi:hypothetical protein